MVSKHHYIKYKHLQIKKLHKNKPKNSLAKKKFYWQIRDYIDTFEYKIEYLNIIDMISEYNRYNF